MKLSQFILTIGLCTTLFLSIGSSLSYGQTPKTTPKTTPTPTTASKPIDDTLKIIKEKIEDKVDEINKSSKKVISGVLNKIDDNLLEVQQSDGRIYKVSVDETVTKFFTATTKKISTAEKDDLDKGDVLVILGPIIEDQISANKVIQQSNYVTAQGEITNVDADNFTVDIVTNNKDEISLDVEQGTTQQIMDTKTLELSKAGFSKYKIGDKIHAVYVKPAKDGDKATTIRTLIIPQEYFAEPINPSKEKEVTPTPKK
jgi:hypothetical protein